MTEVRQIYRCSHCGNTVEIMGEGEGVLICCGAKMKLLTEQTADATMEKHVPIIQRESSGIRVKVGSVPHPMTPDHFIECIDLEVDGTLCRKWLTPKDPPEAFFPVIGIHIVARELCNVHGLWKN